MKTTSSLLFFAVIAALGLGFGAGYYGHESYGGKKSERGQESTSASTETDATERDNKGRKILYYRNPMGLPDTSPTPKKDSMGMDYIPVYQDEQADENETAAPKKERKVLYYRNAMGLADTSPVPKKDAMGMDYVPVYEDEQADAGGISVSPDRLQMLGVKTETVRLAPLDVMVHAAGTIAVNERSLFTIAPKVGGWIEKLAVNATGDQVKAGQPLLEVYSPELVAAQEEYLVARQTLAQLANADAHARQVSERMVQAALQRLQYWDLPKPWLQELQDRRQVRRTVPVFSPTTGVVLEKAAVEGLKFEPGETLFRIADLNQVWLLADVFEQDLPLLTLGQSVQVSLSALPGVLATGLIDFIYPTLSEATRTARVRIVMQNPQGRLKPSMYAQVEIRGQFNEQPVLQVSKSAVIDSGRRQVVLVQQAEGRFSPREVTVGYRSLDRVQILSGVTQGEKVVTRGNFLIDAESNLKAVLSSLSAGDKPAESAPTSPMEHSGHTMPSNNASPSDAMPSHDQHGDH